jgi:hypothetical protein
MQKLLTLLFILLFVGCTTKEPSPDCQNAGKFVMTLKNEEGLIKIDSASKQFTVLFSPDGSLEYSTVAIPCNLKPEFQHEFLVRFDADFFELKDDSLRSAKNTFSMYIRKIEFL